MSSRVRKYGELILLSTIQTVRTRVATVTRAINREFWELQDDIEHGLLVGSYRRGTAINTSDVDLLLELPKFEYERHDRLEGNGQSRLLQSLKNAI